MACAQKQLLYLPFSDISTDRDFRFPQGNLSLVTTPPLTGSSMCPMGAAQSFALSASCCSALGGTERAQQSFQKIPQTLEENICVLAP